MRQEGPGGRLLVFAHDAHVKNAPTEGGVWSAFSRPPRSMGRFLRRALGVDAVLFIDALTPAHAAATSH